MPEWLKGLAWKASRPGNGSREFESRSLRQFKGGIMPVSSIVNFISGICLGAGIAVLASGGPKEWSFLVAFGIIIPFITFIYHAVQGNDK